MPDSEKKAVNPRLGFAENGIRLGRTTNYDISGRGIGIIWIFNIFSVDILLCIIVYYDNAMNRNQPNLKWK